MVVPLKAFVSKDVLRAACIVGMIISIATTATRTIVRITTKRMLHADDYFLYFALVMHIALCSLYLADLPYLYRFFAVAGGDKPPYPGLADDYRMMMKISIAVTAFFWIILWAVKFSVLAFFRTLMVGTTFMKRWWFVTIFTAVMLVGCLISQITSCKTFPAFITLGECISKPEQRAQIISLYFSAIVDLITDLMIMSLPWSLLAQLQISRQQKLGLLAIFGFTAVCMIFAIVRVIQIQSKTGINTPSPAWLGLWAVIETTVAIVVGCFPAFAQWFRTSQRQSRMYDSSKKAAAANRWTNSESSNSRTRRESLQLTHISGKAANRTKIYSQTLSSSTDQIIPIDEKNISVSTEVRVFSSGERVGPYTPEPKSPDETLSSRSPGVNYRDTFLIESKK